MTNSETSRFTPLVSVVMPVRNGVPYLDHSIQSILNQTMQDFELIILDDNSTDETGRVLREYERSDERIRVFRSEQNLGLSGSSNYVVAKANAPLVARMDGDDISHPDRLRRQWEVFKNHPETQLVGTLWEGIDASGKHIRPRDRWRLVRRSTFVPFPHGSVMFRRAAFNLVGGYRRGCAFWEDLDFFLRLAKTGQIFVIPDALYNYRFHMNGSRFTEDTDIREVEKGLKLLYRCLSECRAGRDYTSLLLESEKETATAKKLPATGYVSIGSARLWSGYSPNIFDSLWQRGDLPWNYTTLLALIWAKWGDISPSTLRCVLYYFLSARDLIATFGLKSKELHEWKFKF